MRSRVLPLLLLAVYAPTVSAQVTTAKLAPDTITVTSASTTPIRVQLSNTGAHVTVVGLNAIEADTLTIATPVTLVLPRSRFALAIIAMTSTSEARVTIRANANASARRFQTTLGTPLSIARTADDAPLTLQANTLESHSVP